MRRPSAPNTQPPVCVCTALGLWSCMHSSSDTVAGPLFHRNGLFRPCLFRLCGHYRWGDAATAT
ncbi:hypothetical protein BaRGS_00018549, partial [Batillaria attramentaria]